MSKPLLADPKRQSEAAVFHRAVFAAHGKTCFFCGIAATDAMHVLPRSQLGRLRYEMPKENGRPGCRRCHERVDRHEIQWPLAVLRAAIKAHNKIARVPMVAP